MENKNNISKITQSQSNTEFENIKNENEKLRSELDRLQLLLQDTTIGVYQTTPDGLVTKANAPLIKMLGFGSLEDIQKYNLESDELILVKDRDIFRKKIEDENNIIGHETQWLKKNGEPIYIRESARAIRDENQNIVFYEGTVEDITSRKIKEIELIESEQKYRKLVELLPNGIAIHRDNKVIYANEKLIQALKLKSLNDLAGRNIFEFCRADYQKIIEQRLQQSLENKIIAEPTEEVFITDKGDEITVEACTVPFEMDGKTHFLTVITDITDKKLVENEIKLSEITYRGMLNSITEAVFIQNIDGSFIDVNKAAETVFGYEHNFFIGKTQNVLSDSTKNDDSKIFEHIVKAYHGETQIFEFCGVKATGEKFQSEVSLVPGLYFGKKVVIAVVRDISERIKSEILLKESEKKFKELIDFAVGGILLGTREGIIYEANSYMCALCGQTKEELVGKHIGDGFFTDNSLKTTPLMFEQLKNGQAIINEREILRPDGTIIPVEIHTKMMPDKSYQSIYHDISERKRAEQQILEAKEHAEKLNLNKEALLKAMPDMVFTFTDKGHIVDFYSNSKNLLLAEPEFFLDRNIFEILPPSLAETTQNKINTVLQTQELTSYQYEIEIHDKICHFEAKMVYLNSETVLSVVRDITERMELISHLEIAKLKAEESDNLKSAFLANMSHEIRTPMNAILGFADLLKDNVAENEKLEYLEIIENSCNQLLMILDDIIEISKIEAGIITKKIESVDLQDLFNRLHSEMQGMIPKGREIQMLLAEDSKSENITIFSDPLKLKQILNNFIANAIKFTEQGTIEIGYKLLNNNSIECYVRDTGLGICPQDLKKIFDRFTQISNKLSPYNSGSGLGLSICKAYSELLGAKIRVESVVGEGSCFYLEIPLKIDE